MKVLACYQDDAGSFPEFVRIVEQPNGAVSLNVCEHGLLSPSAKVEMSFDKFADLFATMFDSLPHAQRLIIHNKVIALTHARIDRGQT